jgi:mono/diheme cytochrome c family protein
VAHEAAGADFSFWETDMAVRAKTIILSLLGVIVLLVVGGALAMFGFKGLGNVLFGPDARPVVDRKFEVTEARLARGKYLAEGPAHCFMCHTDHDMTVPEYPIIAAKKGAGWVMPIPELNNIASRNITQDRETGIGDWTDDEIARAIREGVRKDGSALFPLMPYPMFASMSDEDLASVVVYLRTIPAVKNTVPTRQLPGPLEYIVKTIPKPITTPVPSHPSSTPAERGKYLATLATCVECHSPTDDKGMPLPGLQFGGGAKFPDPLQKRDVFTVNITPDPSGIAHYDEAMFLQTIRTGSVLGRKLNHIMPFESFKTMTDSDLGDIFAYLKTLPPVKHRISNTDPPTMCPLCNQSHGLGELNVKK